MTHSHCSRDFFLHSRPTVIYLGVAGAFLTLGGALELWPVLGVGLALAASTLWLRRSPVARLSQDALEFRPGLGARKVVVPLACIEDIDASGEALLLTPRPMGGVEPVSVPLDILDDADGLVHELERALARLMASNAEHGARVCSESQSASGK